MGFFTRITLEDNVAKQISGTTLTLSGETNFVGRLKSKGIEIDASTGGTFPSYVLTLDTDSVIRLKPSSSGGSGLYTQASPSTINLGGIPAGTVLTNRPLEDILEQLLVVYQTPTFSVFNISIPSLLEVGNPNDFTGNQTFTWNTTNSSNVSPNTISITDVTSGNIILGSGLPNDGNEILNLNTSIENEEPIIHTWRIDGINTKTNAMTSRTRVIESIYPWFYGTFDGGAVPAGVNRPDVSNQATAQDLLDSGTKVLAKSNGTLIVPDFNATNQDYLWIAVPTSSTLKTKWYVNDVDKGDIGGGISAGGNLFPTPDIIDLDEPTTIYWSGISYRFYLSNKQVAATSMEFRNN